MIVPLLLTFAFLPDNTGLPSSFNMAGYAFNALASAPKLLINESGGEKGLQFPKEGLMVSLPASVSVADIRACSFADPLKVEALGLTTSAIDSFEVAGNTCVDFKLRGFGLEEIRFTGGGNEGLLVSINIAIESQGPR